MILNNFEHFRGRMLSSGTAGNEIHDHESNMGDGGDKHKENVTTGQNE